MTPAVEYLIILGDLTRRCYSFAEWTAFRVGYDFAARVETVHEINLNVIDKNSYGYGCLYTYWRVRRLLCVWLCAPERVRVRVYVCMSVSLYPLKKILFLDEEIFSYHQQVYISV